MTENLKILSKPEKFKEKESLYIALRKQEGRFYPDEVLAKIPYLGDSSHLAKEWKVRAKSAEKLNKYLAKKNKPLQILDLGCGNGWLANFMRKKGNTVTAVDVNIEELKLGARVFAGNKNLQFIYGDIFENILPEKSFDIIVCAASIQYFPKLEVLIKRLFTLLKPKGEIHFVDCPIYNENELDAAKQRSLDYFIEKGFTQMAQYYHHHSWSELKGFNYKRIRGPLLSKVQAKISGMPNFPWIVINND
jgi:ubiquinone/menaquinone biosynthesis C-methylase UbiE